MSKKQSKKRIESFGKEPMPAPYDTQEDEIPTDVLGSYTGVPLDRSRPEQDADDL